MINTVFDSTTDLESTMVVNRASYEFICKMANKVEEVKALIEAGFEYVCEFNGVKAFRKRK